MYQTTVKKKYSEHTNMIFHVKRSQFHFFKRTCFNKVYKLDVYFSHNDTKLFPIILLSRFLKLYTQKFILIFVLKNFLKIIIH